MEPLILQKKTEVLLNQEVYPMLQKFPKAEKFALCQEIKQAFYRVIRNTMLANNIKKNRIHYLQQVDADLKLLLVLFLYLGNKNILQRKNVYIYRRK